MEASADAGAAAAAAAARTLRWAGRAGHLAGVPRAAVLAAVGAFAKAYALLLNTTTVHNADALLRLVSSRPAGTPLLTVSNHMSTVDDPLMWGFNGFPTMDAKLGSGFEKVMPEKSFFGRRPPVPLWNKEIDIIVGEPIEFDMASLKQEASMVPRDSSTEKKGWPTITPNELDEAVQRWLYQKMSDKIQSVMETLRKTLLNLKQH